MYLCVCVYIFQSFGGNEDLIIIQNDLIKLKENLLTPLKFVTTI